MEVYSGNPRNVATGTKDVSGRVKERIQRGIPQFLPIFFVSTPKGGYRSEIVSGGELFNLYGDTLADDRNEFSNYNTFFLKAATRNGSAVVKRLPFTPDVNSTNADGVASLTVWATINVNPVLTNKPLLRDQNSGEAIVNVLTLQEDPVGQPITSGVNYVSLSVFENRDANGLVPKTELTPKLFTGGFGVHGDAISYPLFTINAPAHGTPYNDYGIWIDALLKQATDGDMLDAGMFPYVMGVYDRTNGRPKRQDSIYGDSNLKFTLNGVKNHPKYNYPISLMDTISKFNKSVSLSSDAVDNKFGDVIIHQNQVDALMDKLFQLELTYQSGTPAFTPYNSLMDIDPAATVALPHLINLFTMRASSGVHYETLRPANMIETEINPIIYTTVGYPIYPGIGNPIYMSGGDNGDLSEVAMNTAIITAMEEYANIDSNVINTATNKESVWVDSGFDLSVKLAAAKLLTHRRDISLITSSYETPIYGSVQSKPLHQSETEALATETLIKNVYSLYPESVEYNTSTSRAAVLVGYGEDVGDAYPGFLPVTYDFMIKNCKFAGAFDGKMNRNATYVSRGQNIITEQKNLYPKEITHTLADQLWNRGAIWMIPNDRKEMMFSSNQTIYPDDTSILNRYIIQIVITTLVKLNDEAWRYFNGTDDMSNEQLKIAVEDYINRRVGKDKFLASIEITPNVYFTKEDLINGFSWHLEVSIASNVAKTVMISNLKSLRLEN